MADETPETTSPRVSKTREMIARASAITIIVVLGVGLAATYGELAQERKAGVTRTQILEELQRDNAALKADNDSLRALFLKQSALLQKLTRGELVTEAELREATQLPPSPTIIVRPTERPAEPVAPPSATPSPTPTVVPAPTPSPTPSPASLACVPLLNLCL